jgi:hypothetical protein
LIRLNWSFAGTFFSQRLTQALVAVAVHTATLSGQPVGTYVGSAVCSGCHRAEGEAQIASAHAHALAPAASQVSAFMPGTELFRPPRYRFRFLSRDGRLRVAISDSTETLELPVDWAFGAGEQAITFVGQFDADHYLEHYFSYYAATRSLGSTPGQVGFPSNSVALASGLLYSALDPVTGIVKCFECHSTGRPIVSALNEISPAEPGVQCEACHGPGSRHVDAASHGQIAKAKSLIVNPARLSAAQLNQLCGRCHRTLDPTADFDWNKAWNVRQQPVYLSQSSCFLKSKGRLSCLTCHNPHQPLQTTLTEYDRKCGGCHDPATHPRVEMQSDSTCVGCHMPLVHVQDALAFTNHWIGIYAADNRTRPVR